MATLRERKTQIKKMQILQRAAEIFQRKGFHITTMDEIANQLMMTKGSLYYYFKNKEEILFVCHEHSLDMVLKALREIQASEESPEIKLRKLLANHMRIIMTEPTALVVATELEPLKGEYRQVIFEKRRTFELGLRQILAEGIGKGVFHKYNPKILGFIILGTLNWITKWYSPAGEMGEEQIIDSISEVLLRAVSRQEANGVLSGALGDFNIELQQCMQSNLTKIDSIINRFKSPVKLVDAKSPDGS